MAYRFSNGIVLCDACYETDDYSSSPAMKIDGEGMCSCCHSEFSSRKLVVAYCVDPDCRCNDRNGVILYDGEDECEMERSKNMCPHGYQVAIEDCG